LHTDSGHVKGALPAARRFPALQEPILGKTLPLILVVTLLVASTLVGCGESSPTPSAVATLSEIEGDVSVMEAGADIWTEGQVGMSLEVGDAAKTGEDSSAEVTFFDGSTIELQPDTEIEITALDIADDGSTTITLEQVVGATISRVVHMIDPASGYEVDTANGAAGVRGSILVVCVTSNGTTWVANQQGTIWTRAHGVELQLPEKRKCLLKPLLQPELLPPNLPPLARNDTFATDEGHSVTVAAPGLLLNDSDPDIYDLLLVTALNTSGTVGTVTRWGPRGAFTYDPNGQFDYLQAGNTTTDSFTYTVTDACGDSDTATVTITIHGVD
jgi:VCBS repeat-containing protein